MDIERTEIRPGMRLGLILIGIGVLDGLSEYPAALAHDLGGTPAVWVNKAVCAVLIAYGIWSARKKIIVDKGAATFVGYVKGARHAEVFIKDIKSVTWDAAKRDWEIKAKQGLLRIGLGRQSKAAGELVQALKDRGVAVNE